jgi:hypothetical protein
MRIACCSVRAMSLVWEAEIVKEWCMIDAFRAYPRTAEQGWG